MAKLKKLKLHGRYPFRVTRGVIGISIPCNRRDCMAYHASIATLIEICGRKDFDARADNLGFKFRLDDKRIVAQFDPATNKNLRLFDAHFKALLKHGHTQTAAKEISRAAFEAAKVAGHANDEAVKIAKAAQKQALKPLSREDATKIAQEHAKPFNGYFIIHSIRKVGKPMTAADKKRLKKKQEDDRTNGIFKPRNGPERQISA